MSTVEKPILPPELAEHTKAVLDKLSTGKPIDPEIYNRIRTEAARVREEILHRHGLLDVAVPAIRELRESQ